MTRECGKAMCLDLVLKQRTGTQGFTCLSTAEKEECAL